MSNPFFFLICAIVLDVTANVLLKYSNGFCKKFYGISAIILVLAAFASMVQAVKTMDLSIAYAIWGGLGLISTSLLDYILFGQKIKTIGWLGICLITCGITLLNLV